MKHLPLALLAWVGVPCGAQTHCSPNALSNTASHARSLQEGLKQIKVSEFDDFPAEARNQMTELKEALVRVADGTLACAEPSADPASLQKQMARGLEGTEPRATESKSTSFGGGDVSVRVSRPKDVGDILGVEFSVGIPCGDDNMLLVYALRDGRWSEEVRWQAPPVDQIPNAFGDFFLWAVISGPEGDRAGLRVAVAHGTPWCTSRFSALAIDVLSSEATPGSPRVLWHTERSYSRGDSTPSRMTSSGDTFEFRANADCMHMDGECFERTVIYRYRVDDRGDVHRIEPIATHARGFVEEWLDAPWSESVLFVVPEADQTLQAVHDEFARPGTDTAFVSHSFGPVRACVAAGTYQVQINSRLERSVVGKPGGESTLLPSHYFRVRETGNGYLMVSVPTEPDPDCKSGNLMPSKSDQ